jgi:hypothetical protein
MKCRTSVVRGMFRNGGTCAQDIASKVLRTQMIENLGARHVSRCDILGLGYVHSAARY